MASRQAGIGAHNRLIGAGGTILRVLRVGVGDWETIDVGDETLHGPSYIHRALADAIDALQTGREPELSARKALNATEILCACYESSRRRGRVDLPLTIDDNPLQAMVASGDLRPPRAPSVTADRRGGTRIEPAGLPSRPAGVS